MALTWSWSASRAAFYPNELRARYEVAGTWPADAQPVSQAEYLAANPAVFDGKKLAADAQGRPIRVAPPTPQSGS